MNARSCLTPAMLVMISLIGCNESRAPEAADRTADAPPPAAHPSSDHPPAANDAGTGWSAAPQDSVAKPARESPPGMSFPSGGKAQTPGEIEQGVTPMTDGEAARYSRVAVALVTAINAEDRAAYRALHTDEGWNTAIDWWQNMFAMQTSKWGRIDRAWPPTRGVVRVGGFGFRGNEGRHGATVMIRFEDGVGGALTFALDESDRIMSTSVFIKEELGGYAPDGVTPIYELPEGE